MATQAEFLANLQDNAVESTPMPALAQPSAIAEPLANVFLQVLESVGGVAGNGDSLTAVQGLVDELIGAGKQVLSLAAGIEGNRDPAAANDPHGLADLDYTVAPARLAVAENAAVWISAEDLVQRVAPFICEHLITVVAAERLVGTMSDAITAIGRFGGTWGAFVSGPSKTADIEQALVMGAHGARTMTVFLLGEPVSAYPADDE